MMDQPQQREIQNQQQQQRSHHRRPPDVEEALSSMLWTPYERTPTDSSSDDDDERLNRKLRKSQSSYEYYQYGGLTLPPPAAIMPFFGSNDPITPFVPLSNHNESVRNNNNINNNSNNISYSVTSINNNSNVNGSVGVDHFRKNNRCDNFRFSYPYYGPIPSLKKCLSVEPPSYDSLYSKSKDATRVLSNLVTVSTTAASGVLQAYTDNVIELNGRYAGMVHSFTDDFVCNSSSSTSASSSTTSVTQQQHSPKPSVNVASNMTANNNFPMSISISDVNKKNFDEYKQNNVHKANDEQKQTEVSQPASPTKQNHLHFSSKISQSKRKKEQQQNKLDSPTHQQRTTKNERIEERSFSNESNEVSSLSASAANSRAVITCRSLTFTTTTATVTNPFSKQSSDNGNPAVLFKRYSDAHLTVNNPPEDNDLIVCNCVVRPSSSSAEEFVSVAMRLNIPATTNDAASVSSSTNVANCGKNVSVTTSSVFLSNSIVATAPSRSSIINNNNNGSSVAILSSSNAPSLTIQVNDGCNNNNNNNNAGHAPHGNFVVNQSIANNGISVVNCTYVNSETGDGVSGSVSNNKNSSSSVPKNSIFEAVNSNQTDSSSSTILGVQRAIETNNIGLQEPASPARTFTSTECQTDDIPILMRDARHEGSIVGGGAVDGTSSLVRNHLHPDAFLSREQRRRERRERRQQQQQQHAQQQQQLHQRLSRNHSHSHPPPQPPLIHHPAHHTMSAAAAAILRPMLPDILHSHFPPPYSALPLSQGGPPPPPPPHAASLITPVISTVPIPPTATMVGDGRFSIPLPIIRRSPSERSGKGCCGQWFAGPPLRALIAVVALGGVACALGGAALGATGLAGPPSSHLTAALLMIGVGVVLVTVSGAAWRLTAPGGPPCLGLGTSVDLGRCGRRPCSRGGGAPHGLLYPEFQHRPPPPSYQASMQEYRLRLLLLDRDRQNGVVRGSSPPPTYRSHAGSLLRAPLTTTIRSGSGAASEYSLPPSYRSRNTMPAILSTERTIETAPSGRLLANEDVPEISSNFEYSAPVYDAIENDDLHQQPQQNSQQNATVNCENRSHPKDKTTPDIKMSPSKQITQTTLSNGHRSSSISKEYPSSGDRTSLSLENSSNDEANPRDQMLHLSEKLNPRVLTNSVGGGVNRTIGFLNSATTSAKSSTSQTSETMTTGKTKDLVTIVTISAQDNTNQLHMQPAVASSQSEMEILAHL